MPTNAKLNRASHLEIMDYKIRKKTETTSRLVNWLQQFLDIIFPLTRQQVKWNSAQRSFWYIED